MRRGGDDSMRVDEKAEAGVPERSDPSFGAAGVVAGLMLGGAAVFAGVGGYLLATTCWSDTWFSGCRADGVAGGVGFVLLAQVVGTIGYLILRRGPRRPRGRGTGPAGPESDPTSTGSRGAGFLFSAVFSVSLFGVGALAAFWGLFAVGLSCLGHSSCDFQSAVLGLVLILSAEVLWVAGFLVARRVFRRRPWRRDVRIEQPGPGLGDYDVADRRNDGARMSQP